MFRKRNKEFNFTIYDRGVSTPNPQRIVVKTYRSRSASVAAAFTLAFGMVAVPASAEDTDPTNPDATSTPTQEPETTETDTESDAPEAPAEDTNPAADEAEPAAGEEPEAAAEEPAEDEQTDTDVEDAEEAADDAGEKQEAAPEALEDVPAGTTIDILSVTDFHGAIDVAPYMQTQFDEVRVANPDGTIFVSSGDLIGGSAYVSAIAQDVPTIDVMNAMGLSIAAVGNHEFDQGYADLTERVIPKANWQYLGANVDGADAINQPPYVIETINGVDVAFIGTVTKETPSIVSADGVEGLTFNDPVAATNELAMALRDGNPDNDEADVVVALIHEGSRIAQNISGDVDLVLSGHAHGIVDTETSGGAKLLEAGSAGSHFAHATITVGENGEYSVAGSLVPVNVEGEADPAIQEIVDQANAEATVLGAEVIGSTNGAWRGVDNEVVEDGETKFPENRGTESSLGNIVANAALFTANARIGGADFGIVNPGGLRADLDPDGDGKITYAEAFGVQPFGNTIGTLDLTGAQVYLMLEQQWQPEQSRPMLRLGLSDNVTYMFDPEMPHGERVTGVWIDGEPIDPDATYTVASNTFLLSGQDNFEVFKSGTNFRESGYVDLDGFIDYIRSLEDQTVLIPAGQRSIGVTVPEGKFVPGEPVTFNLSSLVFTNAELLKPVVAQLVLDGEVLGEATISHEITDGMDYTGMATVTVTFPEDLTGEFQLELRTLLENDGVDTSFMIPLVIDGDQTTPEDPEESEAPGEEPGEDGTDKPGEDGADKPGAPSNPKDPGNSNGAGPSKPLPNTGASVMPLALMSLALITVGTVAVRRTRHGAEA